MIKKHSFNYVKILRIEYIFSNQFSYESDFYDLSSDIISFLVY